MTLPNINHESDEFLPLCAKLGIEYPSTIHHFVQHDDGTVTPVVWSDAQATRSEGRKV